MNVGNVLSGVLPESKISYYFARNYLTKEVDQRSYIIACATYDSK